jgi:NAD(P)-dependent dehydrogenase (short-subunit alcohol dehydrogenase family)
MSDLSSYPNITLLELDVTSPSSISNAFSTISNRTSGKLDYLLNYAGHGYTIPFIDTNIDIAQKMFDVNVWGAMRVTQAFASLVIKAKGTIVMAGSTAELLGVPFQAAYCGSKAALQVMTDALRIEIQPFGVRVLYVTTGYVKTNWCVSSYGIRTFRLLAVIVLLMIVGFYVGLTTYRSFSCPKIQSMLQLNIR